MTTDETPKIHVDSDWKAEAQAEKEKLVQAEAAKTDAPDEAGSKLPPADFKGLVGLLASQAVMGLGAMPDAVSYIHLTLPTTYSVEISAVAVPLINIQPKFTPRPGNYTNQAT